MVFASNTQAMFKCWIYIIFSMYHASFALAGYGCDCFCSLVCCFLFQQHLFMSYNLLVFVFLVDGTKFLIFYPFFLCQHCLKQVVQFQIKRLNSQNKLCVSKSYKNINYCNPTIFLKQKHPKNHFRDVKLVHVLTSESSNEISKCNKLHLYNNKSLASISVNLSPTYFLLCF